ncbi:MAG: heavy metal-binding domain-containing protein [Nanoarchaeota archaeon]|nr:heavy metal-binding domain-containing protein [Nanoarchaeota archaeon]MBU1135561.1 heavy metal-binding domain-containing protein [Nanoarchaeota archaeon]MBU2520374.1 heavy metal-binding domain-containing protein [Nanoarchaeota archaeon]
MIITTTESIEGKKIIETIGLVRGNTIRAKHIGKDIVAGFRGIVGGEIKEYTEMMTESREQAMERMVEDAKKKGANAIIGLRFTTSMISAGSAELLAYGTGVKVK